MNPDPWIEARRRHHLSHAHVQMARELGMNPRKLGKIDNHRQEQWKAKVRRIERGSVFWPQLGAVIPVT